MKEIKDGGPAFPASRMEEGSSPEAEAVGGYFEVQYSGMTLRDYFAAKAMQAIYMRQGGSPADTDPSSMLYTAEHAYAQADAMLRTREAK